MINMVSIAFLTLNLTLNQMKVKNTDKSTNMKCSSKLSKSIDISIKKVKVQNMQKCMVHIPSFKFFKDQPNFVLYVT